MAEQVLESSDASPGVHQAGTALHLLCHKTSFFHKDPCLIYADEVVEDSRQEVQAAREDLEAMKVELEAAVEDNPEDSQLLQV